MWYDFPFISLKSPRGDNKLTFLLFSYQGLHYSKNSRPIWFAPKISQLNVRVKKMAHFDDFSGNSSLLFCCLPQPWTKSNGGEQAQFYTLFDKAGSLIGGRGYLVANNLAILPPGKKGCWKVSKFNAFACRGVCYRTVAIWYPESGFTRSWANSGNTRQKFR